TIWREEYCRRNEWSGAIQQWRSHIMNRTAVFEAVDQLWGSLSNLSGTTQLMLERLEGELCRKTEPFPGDLRDKAIRALVLGYIAARIEEMMRAFDDLCRAAGGPPTYELALRLLDAPRPVRAQVRQRLDGLPDGFAGPC